MKFSDFNKYLLYLISNALNYKNEKLSMSAYGYSSCWQ